MAKFKFVNHLLLPLRKSDSMYSACVRSKTAPIRFSAEYSARSATSSMGRWLPRLMRIFQITILKHLDDQIKVKKVKKVE